MLHNYGIDSIFVIKAIIGILSLICGWGVIYGFFKKEQQFKPPKEGRIRIRVVMLLIGIGIVGLAWFSHLPLMLADWTGLSNTFDFGGETGLQGGIGTRIFTSILTALGIIICRFSIKREKQVIAQTMPTEETYRKALERGGEY